MIAGRKCNIFINVLAKQHAILQFRETLRVRVSQPNAVYSGIRLDRIVPESRISLKIQGRFCAGRREFCIYHRKIKPARLRLAMAQ